MRFILFVFLFLSNTLCSPNKIGCAVGRTVGRSSFGIYTRWSWYGKGRLVFFQLTVFYLVLIIIAVKMPKCSLFNYMYIEFKFSLHFFLSILIVFNSWRRPLPKNHVSSVYVNLTVVNRQMNNFFLHFLIEISSFNLYLRKRSMKLLTPSEILDALITIGFLTSYSSVSSTLREEEREGYSVTNNRYRFRYFDKH